MIEVHVLAGGLETGLVSGLGGRLDGACPDPGILCLTFRDLISDSWCVSETPATETCTGSAEFSEDSPISRWSVLKAGPLTGSERSQLMQPAHHQAIQRAHLMMARVVATQTLAGSVGIYVTVPQGRSTGTIA